MIRSINIDLDQAIVWRWRNKFQNFLAPSVNPKSWTVTARTADTTLTADDLNAITTNAWDSGAQVLTLPAARLAWHKCLKVAVLAAQDITIATIDWEKIYLNWSWIEWNEVLIAGVIGNFADIYSDGTDYIVTNYSGVLTTTNTVVSNSTSSSASSSASSSLSTSSSVSSSASSSLSASSSVSSSRSSSLSASSSVSPSTSISSSVSSSISNSPSSSLSTSSSVSPSTSVSSSRSSSISSSVSPSI